MARQKGKDVIKSTKYCDLLRQASLVDEDYTYCIERIYVKAKKMEEIRFTLYKEILNSGNGYIPRSLDVTEIELIKLMKECVKTTISREKLYERNYIRDSVEKIKYDGEANSRIKYNSLVKVLASIYLDSPKGEV